MELEIRRLDDKEVSDLFEDIRSLWNKDCTNIIVELGPEILRKSTSGLDIPSNFNIIKLTLMILEKVQDQSRGMSIVTRYKIIFSRDLKGGRENISTLLTNNIELISEKLNINDQKHKKWLEDNNLSLANAVSKIQKLAAPKEGYREKADLDYSVFLAGIERSQARSMEEFRLAFKELSEYRIELDKKFDDIEEERRLKYQRLDEDLTRRESELNKSSHKSERRKLFDLLTSTGKESRRKGLVSREYKFARWSVVVICVIFGSIFALVSLKIAETVPQFANSSGGSAIPEEYLIIKSVLSAMAATAAFAFSVSWIRTFYEKDIEDAREVERLNADMIRANWAIETILEVEEQYDREVSPDLIKNITKNLFEAPINPEKNNDAALALQALLGFTGSASFGPDGTRVQIDKKEARQLAAASKKSDG